MITASQLLLSIIIIFMILRTFGAYRKKNLSESFSIVWIVFWLGVLFLVFQQDLVSSVAHRVGISRGVDLVIYLSLIVIFYIIYRILVYLQELDYKITKLVRRISIKEMESIKKK